jgi:hypothetical protein
LHHLEDFKELSHLVGKYKKVLLIILTSIDSLLVGDKLSNLKNAEAQTCIIKTPCIAPEKNPTQRN